MAGFRWDAVPASGTLQEVIQRLNLRLPRLEATIKDLEARIYALENPPPP